MSQSASAHLNRYTCYGAIEVIAIIIIIIIIIIVPQRILWLSIARANRQLDPRCS